ncbi:AAA family ATPase [Streptomyces goshikiensis]|uniref:AAA family ATPase n=1 Tax=Streptomyces goshikiensis TaxID=1942 RepID=UPI0037F9E94C
MPLTDTEWGLVTTWVRDYFLDTLDPRERLTQSDFSPEFIGDLPLTNKSGPNAVTLVHAARRDIGLQCHLLGALVDLDELSVLEAGAEARRFLDRLLEDARVHSSAQDHFLATVLRNGTEVFIDRAELRKRLREFLADPEQTVLVVDGEPDSGRSYTYSLLRYLGQHCGFRPVRVTLSRTSTADQVVRRLAEFVGDPGADSGKYDPSRLNDRLPSVEDAVHRIVSRATTADEQFWLVLDECDVLDAGSDVWDCIGQLALAIYDRTAKPGETLPRLVLLGYPTQRQLPYYVRKNVCRDTARAVGPEDLRGFFRAFFQETPAPAPAAGAPAPGELVEVAVPAILDAARGPGDDSYMRKLCTACEQTVRLYRELGPGEAFATRLRAELLAAAEAPPPDVPDTRRAYREAACLLTGFDPTRLRLPGESAAAGAAALELVHECRTLSMSPHTTWALKQEVRDAALRGLAGPGAARLVLEANLDQVPEGPGPERAALAYLHGRPPALERQGVDELADTLQALLWLSRIPGTTGLPDPEHVQRLLERARLLQPLQRLVQGSFCGRAEELEQLRRYVGPPSDTEEPPLLIHGMGGMGKSTLLARFLLGTLQDPAAATSAFRFPFAYVDFERPTLSVHEPVTLIAEIARQLGTQYPGHRAAFDALAGACEETARAQRREQSRIDELYQLSTTRSGVGRGAAEAFHAAARDRESDLVRRVAELLVQAMALPPGAPAPPLLIVVDSFEEAQYRASPALGRVWAIWAALQRAYPRLRCVVAGRAPVNHPARAAEVRTIALGDLEPDAAVQLLMSCGVGSEAVARDLAERVGGHPLSLKLAARAAQEAGSLSGLVESLPPKRHHIHHKVDQMLVQGILYDRVLRHIADDEVRALAHAGLALRVITPDLIREVLAGPCGLRVDTPEEARRLFGGLARLDLVEPAGPDGIRHRADLRAIMLRLSDTARADLMRDVGRRAVEHYAAREGLEARAEEIYQRLRLNEDPRSVEQRWEPGVERFLDNADQDMASRSAAFLTGHLGGHTPDQVLIDADQEDWERIAAREVEDLLAQGFTDTAAARLAERRPWTPGSPLHALLVETLARRGRRAEARAAAEAAVDRAEETGSTDVRLDLLLLSARLAEEDGDPRAAERDLVEAEDIATALGRDFDAMGAMLHRARLVASPGAGSDIDRRLALRLRGLSDEALTERPVLVRAVAAEVSREDPVALDHTLEVVGLPDTDDAALEALAVSIDHVVAREPGLRLALARILENAASGTSDASQEALRSTGSAHVGMSGILRAARARGTLDRLARRLLELRDQSGELVSGVASAMGAGGSGNGPRGNTGQPKGTAPERRPERA